MDFYVDNDAKVRAHCHITRKYRGSAQRDCNITLKLNQFHNMRNYDSYLVMQEFGKFSLKINVMPN